ncbi:hypothetical protein EJB05_08051 [Eragrostis curvula]|uniref:RING-type domain-containing protein n=1 Tax=Eragrostis curvula TaxID=38414 RepID=A0A5J9WKE8_9POAL|nr:hypothetical protein EJB05_08051 [Eragrostis curvula]
MAAAWARAKRALATSLCISVPEPQRTIEDAPPLSSSVSECKSESTTVSSLRRTSSGSRNTQKLCAICLGGMRTGHGQALFTAECSHRFHFHCISSNVKHGNLICPICRAEWKELPGAQPADANHGRARVRPLDWAQAEGHMAVVRRLSHRYSGNLQELLPAFHTPEAGIFDDDEHIDLQSDTVDEHNTVTGSVEMKTYSEFPAIQESVTKEVFSILIHLKAPKASHSASTRAPLDLVTVLDVSGSMAGDKISLLKHAMSFVIQTLGPNDRLSVITFSSTARRLFPLRRMTLTGRQQALQAVSSLVASGGTNIADGLRKGAKVIEDRRLKNPVCSIILLSDGQDTYSDRTQLNEERGFLVTLHVPAAHRQTVLIKPSCSYQDTITMENMQIQGKEVSIQRPEHFVDCKMAPEVQREWHRVQATEDMSAARAAAEGGAFAQAVSILEGRRRILESQAANSSDNQCLALITELKEMQERVESRQRYEESGRAFMLSGLSSHTWQRATTRGDSTEVTTQIHTYQTPSMVDMLQRSQVLVPPSAERLNRSPTVTPSNRPSHRSSRSMKSFFERFT